MNIVVTAMRGLLGAGSDVVRDDSVERRYQPGKLIGCSILRGLRI